MNNRVRIDLRYTLVMTSDFHVGSGMTLAGVADRAVVRLANGELVVPGSTIKGRVRHSTELIARTLDVHVCSSGLTGTPLCQPEDDTVAARDLCLICRLFGSEWWPGGLYFSDARLDPAISGLVFQMGGGDRNPFDYQIMLRTRTRIDRRSRRVVEGALFTFEEGTAGLMFQGRITGTLLAAGGCESPLSFELLGLLAGLRLLDRLGGKKTVGRGRCRIEIEKLKTNGTTVDKAAVEGAMQNYLEQLILYDDYRKQ